MTSRGVPSTARVTVWLPAASAGTQPGTNEPPAGAGSDVASAACAAPAKPKMMVIVAVLAARSDTVGHRVAMGQSLSRITVRLLALCVASHGRGRQASLPARPYLDGLERQRDGVAEALISP